MSNQIHRQLEQGELHRPERTGTGSPVGQSFTFLEDGQYYQDTDTGSVWRYRAFTNSWEQLLQYDRGTGQIVNVTTGVAVQATNLGKTTSALGTGTITGVIARLVVQIQAGTDIKIISTASDDITISLTVLEDVGPGDVTIDVQPTTSNFTFPVGSSIVLESGLQGAYDSVDPTKLERKIERSQESTTIGTIGGVVGASQTAVTQISLQLIPDTIELRDGQVLVIMNQRGESQKIVVDGAQTLQAGNGILTIQTFDPIYNYIRGRAFVYEPSYKSTTRITQTENSIELQASQISGLDTFTSTLNVAVNENAAQISLLAQADTAQNVAISSLEANASAQQATLGLLTSFTDSLNTSVASLELNASAQQATLGLLTTFTDGLNTSVAGLQANASAQQASLILLAGVSNDQANSIAAIEANVSNQSATLSLVTQVQQTQNVQISVLQGNVLTLAGETANLNAQIAVQTTAIAALDLNASAQQATLSLLTSFNDATNTSIASLVANASAQQATLSAIATFSDNINTSVSSLVANASAQQATLSAIASFSDNINTSVSSLVANASAQQATLSLITSFNDTANSSIASLVANASAQQATISLLASFNDNVNTSVATLVANASAQQATLSAIALFSDNINTSVSSLVANASAQQATINLLAAFNDTTNTAVASLEANASAQQARLSAIALFSDNVNTSISSLVANASAQQATLSTSVQYNNVGAYIQLLAGPAGSEITLQANQINIDGVVTFINDEATTTIDGDRITTGTITASQINVGDLFSETIEVGNVIKSNNYVVDTTGFAIFSNGYAEFQDVTVAGKLISGAGSALDGNYVSNINAGTITVGTLSADRIASNSIVASKIVSGTITALQIQAGSINTLSLAASSVSTDKLQANAVTAAKINVADLYATNATVNGVLTIDGGKLITKDSGNYVEITSAGIRGVDSVLGETFKLPTDGSAPIFASGQILSTAFFIGVNSVLKTSDNALAGDAGVLVNNTGIFAGSAGQNTSNANFRVLASDGSLVAQSANIAGKLVAQSGSFVEGIYVSNINASSITTGTIDAERINVDALFAESITATNTITIGATGKITNATSDFELSSNGLSLALISGTVQGSEPSAIKWDPKIYIAGEASTIGGRESTLRIATQQLVIESNTGNGVGVQIFGDVDIDGFLESDYISATSGLASITSSLLYAPSTEVTGYLDVTGTLDVGANATFSSNVSIAKDLELSGNAIIDSIIIKLDNIPTSPSATANCVWVDANGFLRLS